MQNDIKLGELDALAVKCREGDGDAFEALMEAAAPIVKNVCRPYFLIGAERDDLYQEGYIGLLKAVRTFDPARSSFRTYARLCVETAVIKAVEKYSGRSNMLLSDGVALDDLDRLPSGQGDPEAIVIESETIDDLIGRADGKLSERERKVLRLYLDGLNYREISDRCGLDAKSIDNALQRIKKKMRELMKEEK